MLRRTGFAIPSWLCLALPAHAHSPFPGIEGFYVGLLHPFSTPPQALLIIGLALLVAGVAQNRLLVSFGVFLFTTLVSLVGGLWIEDSDGLLYASAVVVSALAALWPRPLIPVVLVMIFLAGFLIGQVSIPDPGPTRDRIVTMGGSYAGASIGLLWLTAGALSIKERCTQDWVQVAFRVVAAWMGAISLVMLALQFAAVEPAG
ncbi:MAG: hypothetical protein ACR2O8_12805 [Rhizobiaceae bacterium]